jgi:hypothetical protein
MYEASSGLPPRIGSVFIVGNVGVDWEMHPNGLVSSVNFNVQRFLDIADT